MAKMTVYHGGYMAVEHPEIRKGRNTKDFGTGFYCTIIKEQAQRWAKRYDTKIVSIYDVRLDSSFPTMTPIWWNGSPKWWRNASINMIPARKRKTGDREGRTGLMCSLQYLNYLY